MLGVFPGLIGVKTGHTNDAGWCQVAAARRSGYTIYAVILGSPTRAQRNTDLQALLAWGVSQYRTLRLIDTQTYAWAAAPFGSTRWRSLHGKPLTRVVRVGYPVTTKIVAPTAVALPVERGQRLGRIEVWSRGKLLGSRPLLAGRSVPRPGVGGRLRWYSTRTVHNLFGPLLMIVTVTLNAAVDRTLTVPNFQTGHRHRASASLTSAGGKGINVARALKRLDCPVIATGLAGGRTGDRIIDELATEAILNDFVRISDESRTSTALVDPTAGMLSEIYEWGPAVRPDELETLLDKLHYLSRVASYVVFSGSLPRDVADDFYAEAIRDLNRRGVQCVLDTEGEPLRVGVEAEPFLVSPNQREAESLVGQEFSEDEDFLVALDAIADLGARNVLITQETSCFGLFREERTLRRFRASIPRVEPVAPVGAGDVLLAGFLAARFNGRPFDEALRQAIGCAAASVVELGPGRFDPREALRLASSVELEELQPISA